MYDTEFFRNTFKLKQDIISFKYSSKQSKDILSKLNTKRNPIPFVFNIETTNYCNMSCVMCQRTTDFKRTLQHMEEDTFHAIVEQIEPQNKTLFRRWQEFSDSALSREKFPSENNFYFDIVSKCITLHGFGEPLLDPNLPERISILTRKSIPTYFSCNPCNIRLDFIEKLFESKTGYIKFALDSLDDHEAKEIRGKKADFIKSYQRILEVLTLKERMKADTVIVLTMLDFFRDRNRINRFFDLWKGKDVYPYIKSVDNKWLLKRKSEIKKTKGENKSHYNKQYCEYAWTSMTILADGSVVPCTQDMNGAWTFGNVNDSSLKDIWNSEKYDEFRSLQLSKDFTKEFICHSKCDWDIVSYYFTDYAK